MRDETTMHLIRQLSMFKTPKWRHTVDEDDKLDAYEMELKGINKEESEKLVAHIREKVFPTVGYSFFPDPAQMGLYWKEMKELEEQAVRMVAYNKKQEQKKKEEEKEKLSQDKINKAHDKAREYVDSLTDEQKVLARQVLLEMYADYIVDLPNPIDERPREVRLPGIRAQIKKSDLAQMLGALITSGKGKEIRQEIESKF